MNTVVCIFRLLLLPILLSILLLFFLFETPAPQIIGDRPMSILRVVSLHLKLRLDLRVLFGRRQVLRAPSGVRVLAGSVIVWVLVVGLVEGVHALIVFYEFDVEEFGDGFGLRNGSLL